MDDTFDLLDGLDIDIPEAPGDASQSEGGEFFGPYQLIQQVGVGGVAKVLRARHIHPGYAETTFAIKILHEQLSRDPNVVNLFRHEAFVLSLLKHPNIVQTFEAGVQDDKLFIAMEYIDGRDLDNMLARCQKANVQLPIFMALHLMGEVLKGLAYAHDLHDADGNRLNLLHRDVNPANVFLSFDGRVKLGDFGVASIAAGKVEEQREVAGKVGYFAPEQLEGKGEVDQRADIFAMGVMMFEMLTRTRLFEASSTDKIMRLNKKAKIPAPRKLNAEISPELEAVMLRALERKPADRFQSAQEMYAALRPFLPQRGGMNLAVAALMRKVFANEHLQEVQLREGLAGGSAVRGAGQMVLVCTPDERARMAFNELLLSRSYRAAVFATTPELKQALGQGHEAEAVLVDVTAPGFDAEQFQQALAAAPRTIPAIGFANGLQPDWVANASDCGALDYLFKPFNIERVLVSVRAAITGSLHVAPEDQPQPQAATAGAVNEFTKVLLVSQDPELMARLSSMLAGRSVTVEVSPNIREALARTDYASYHIVVYDTPAADLPAAGFIQELRSRPGVGLLPVLFLSQNGNGSQPSIPDRCVSLPREVDERTFREHIHWLRQEAHGGRIFERYSARFPIELRYGGRVFSGESIDISRGGMMLHCDQMPPVGMEVGISLKIAELAAPIEVQGQIIRVGMAGEEQAGRSQIGVEFHRFAARGEADLIEYIRRFQSNAQPALVQGAPPPAPPSAMDRNS